MEVSSDISSVQTVSRFICFLVMAMIALARLKGSVLINYAS